MRIAVLCLLLLLMGCPTGTVDDDDATDDSGDDDDSAPSPADRIVIAGDSWSTGSVNPTQTALVDLGYGDVTVTWEGTAVAGSQASEWVANQDGKLDALAAALDAEDGADVLLLYLGGNDYNFALNQGLGPFPELALPLVLDGIEQDLQALVDWARSGRPGLTVVIVGYCWFHYEWFTTLFGLSLDVGSTLEYNQGLGELEARKLAIAQRTQGVEYVHNLGILQHTMGLVAAPPWSLPLVDYPPQFFDAPSPPPLYDPFPGGVRRADIDPSVIPPESLPGPTAGFLDGIHPSDAGWAILVQSVYDQGLAGLLDGVGFAPP